MGIQIDFSELAETRWYEYAVRFLFGGLITATAGLIAKEWGPAVGGLFLAFPAIFPAGATLIEKHEKEKKEHAGMNGTKRAAELVGADAVGAAFGSVGLAIFGMIVWQTIPKHSPWLVLTCATAAWLGISLLLWEVRKRL